MPLRSPPPPPPAQANRRRGSRVWRVAANQESGSSARASAQEAGPSVPPEPDRFGWRPAADLPPRDRSAPSATPPPEERLLPLPEHVPPEVPPQPLPLQSVPPAATARGRPVPQRLRGL